MISTCFKSMCCKCVISLTFDLYGNSNFMCDLAFAVHPTHLCSSTQQRTFLDFYGLLFANIKYLISWLGFMPEEGFGCISDSTVTLATLNLSSLLLNIVYEQRWCNRCLLTQENTARVCVICVTPAMPHWWAIFNWRKFPGEPCSALQMVYFIPSGERQGLE